MRNLKALLLLAPLACTPSTGTTETASESDSETETTNASQDSASTGVTTSTVTSTTTMTSGVSVSSTTDATMTEGSSTTDSDTDTSTTSGEPCNHDLVCDDDETLMGCLHDCGMCEADSTCDGSAETPYSCAEDCPATDCNNDGTVDALSEQCDDGNAEDGDACTSECAHAVCGDGYVYAQENGGNEECDDGNEVDGDGCANDCTIERRNVFITSDSYQGNIGGLGDADANCQSLAEKAGLTGTYMAWLSDANSGPSDRFGVDPNFTGVFQLVDGTVLANGWGDLVDGELATTISQNESGGNVGSSSVWTNTDASGSPKGDVTCTSWTSASGLVKGQIGLSEQSDSLWTDFDDTQCSNPARLYCFQVQ